MMDHMHMLLISTPPKILISRVIDFINGKSAIYVARNYLGQKRNFTDLWAGGYHVSTVGRDKNTIRQYINQVARAG
jgi:putative transposase